MDKCVPTTFTPLPRINSGDEAMDAAVRANARKIAFAGVRDSKGGLISDALPKVHPDDPDALEVLREREDAVFAAYSIDPTSPDADRIARLALQREFLPAFQMREDAEAKKRDRPNSSVDNILVAAVDAILEGSRGPKGVPTITIDKAIKAAIDRLVHYGILPPASAKDKHGARGSKSLHTIYFKKRPRPDTTVLRDLSKLKDRLLARYLASDYPMSHHVTEYMHRLEYDRIMMMAAALTTDVERRYQAQLERNDQRRARDFPWIELRRLGLNAAVRRRATFDRTYRRLGIVVIRSP
jgi:hypothetical protein